MLTLESWLAQLGLEKYAPVLRAQEIQMDQVATLTEADLKELGLPLGPRKRILAAAAELAEAADSRSSAKPVAPVAERRQVTIMFVDLAGSTALSGRLDPEDLRTVLRSYHETTAAQITRWGGTVAKLMGDGVLAYFGWPLAQESAAERAVRAGLDINSAVGNLTTPTGEALAARTGIATGLVVIGDLIGEGAAQEAAIAGETPNLAARLQSCAEPGGLVVSAQTMTLAGAQFEATALPPLELKGIANRVHAFAVTGTRHGMTRFAARAGADASPMLGRHDDMALLTERFRRAAAGHGQLTILTADAGMGKSRLAESFLESAGVGPDQRMTWQCAPFHTTTPFHPVLASLSPEIVARLEPQHRAALARLSGPSAADPTATPAQARHAALEAIGAAAVAFWPGAGPAVLLLEDAHWIDPSTLDALHANLEFWSAQHIFVLATARPSFQEDFGGHSCVTRLSLGRLDRAGVDALARAAAGGHALPQEALDDIAAKSDGVPLYVEETTKTLLDSGVLRLNDGAWALARPLSSAGVPATLADGLMARLDRLADAKETAQEAAVIGRQFSYADVEAIASARPPRLTAALDRLTDSQIVTAHGAPPATIYQFKHALLRDAAYDSLLKSRRAALHAQFARRLETSAAAPLELRAWHLEAAGRKADALAAWRGAGEAAMARPAYKEAISHFRRALALAEGPETLKVATRMGLAAIAAQGHSHPDTVAIFEAASTSPHLADDPASAFVVWYGLWCGHHVRGEAALARDSSSALHRASLAQGSPANIMMGVRSLGITALMNGDVREALARHQDARQMEDIARDRGQAQIVGQDQSVSFRSYFGIALWLAGRPKEAWATIEESVRFARDGGHPGSLGYGLTHAILAAFGLGQAQTAHRWTQELLAKASEYRLEMWRDYGLRFDAVRIVRESGDASAMRVAREALARRSVGLFSAYLDGLTAEALLAHGNIGEADVWLRLADASLAEGRESWAAAKLLSVRAAMAGRQGRDDEARALARLAHSRAVSGGLAAFELEPLSRLADQDLNARDALAKLVNTLGGAPEFPGVAQAHAILAPA